MSEKEKKNSSKLLLSYSNNVKVGLSANDSISKNNKSCRERHLEFKERKKTSKNKLTE
jgi:hypothetical protein